MKHELSEGKKIEKCLLQQLKFSALALTSPEAALKKKSRTRIETSFKPYLSSSPAARAVQTRGISTRLKPGLQLITCELLQLWHRIFMRVALARTYSTAWEENDTKRNSLQGNSPWKKKRGRFFHATSGKFSLNWNTGAPPQLGH